MSVQCALCLNQRNTYTQAAMWAYAIQCWTNILFSCVAGYFAVQSFLFACLSSDMLHAMSVAVFQVDTLFPVNICFGRVHEPRWVREQCA